jgi:hypothetical protein
VRRAFALIAPFAVVLSALGCGYVDDNPQAARVVAQAYLDAFAEHDAAGICRVVAPEVQAALAAGRTSCDAGAEEQLGRSYPRLTVGRTQKVVPAPPNNPRYTVEVRGEPGRWIVVGRYGSTWRVVDGGAPAPT